ncbi:MAG: Ig-like domain-containing protein, partial [Coriobacteriia bacterium]|nr:Ig-like domain-containing protein [Coriobacteriia bacterium]
NGAVLSTQQVRHGDAAEPPSAPWAFGREFIGWNEAAEWWNVTNDIAVTSFFAYGSTAESPFIMRDVELSEGEIEELWDLESADYLDFENVITLQSSTDNASILYSLVPITEASAEEEMLEFVEYDGSPILITEDSRLTFMAVSAGMNDSGIVTMDIPHISLECEDFEYVGVDTWLFLETVEGVPGEIVHVPVYISGAELIDSFAHTLNYNNAAMTYLKALTGSEMDAFESELEEMPLLTTLAFELSDTIQPGDQHFIINFDAKDAGGNAVLSSGGYGHIVVLDASGVSRQEQLAPVEFEPMYAVEASGDSFTVVIPPTAGAEYSFDGMVWTSSNTLVAQQPEAEITGWKRMAARLGFYASPATAASVRLPAISDERLPQVAPAVPTIVDRTATTVTLNIIDGAEFSRDGVNWQDSPTFSGLVPGVTYSFFARMKMTATHYASPPSGVLAVRISKIEQSAPAAPTVRNMTATSVTLNAIDGAEFSRNGTTWQSSPVFAGLTPETTFRFFARFKETVIHEASPPSVPLTVTTPRAPQAPPQQVLTHTVTFNSHGGSAVDSRQVNAGEAIGELPTPIRTGYTFAGWWTAQTGGNQASAQTRVDANITLHARWQAILPTRVTIAGAQSNTPLLVNRTRNLTANVTPTNAANRNVSWTSSNTRVATINSNGQIRALRPGTTTITVRTVADRNITATATIRVQAAPTRINSSVRNITLRRGTNFRIPVVVKGNTNTSVTVNWQTTNRNVASLSSNRSHTKGTLNIRQNSNRVLTIRAIRTGNARITLTTLNGRTITYNIRVVNSTQRLNRVRITNLPSNNRMRAGQTRQLNARLTPTRATLTGQLRWTSSRPRVASVDGAGRVTAHRRGETNITLRVGNQTHRVRIVVR